MISINIDVTKIDNTSIYEGKKGKYLSITLLDNRDGTDQYGNDGFVVQDLGKERRQNGEKGPILGNWKHLQTKQVPAADPIAEYKARHKQPAPPQHADEWF